MTELVWTLLLAPFLLFPLFAGDAMPDIATLQSAARDGAQAIAPWSLEESLQKIHSDLRGFYSKFALSLAIVPHLGI